MAWSLIALLLLGSGLFHGIGAADEENLPSAQVVGTVLCAPCFNRGFSRTRHFISGASVLLECADLGIQEEVTTDDSGKFEVHLPPPTSEDAGKTQGCTVKLIRSSNPRCDAASSRASLRLELNRQGPPQVLPVGVLAFTPREQPSSCARKPTRRGSLGSISKKVSTNSEPARRAPVNLPPVLASTTLPPISFPPFPAQLPLPPFFSPPTPAFTPPPPHFPWPLSPSPSLPPSFPFPLPPLPPIPQTPPFPVTPPSTFLPFPPLPQPLFPWPLTPSPSISLPPSFPFPLPPLPPIPPTPPFPVPPIPSTPPFPFPPLPGFAPPLPTPRH